MSGGDFVRRNLADTGFEFTTPPAGSGDPSFTPGSITIGTGTFRYFAQRIVLTTTQRVTVEGTGILRIG